MLPSKRTAEEAGLSAPAPKRPKTEGVPEVVINVDAHTDLPNKDLDGNVTTASGIQIASDPPAIDAFGRFCNHVEGDLKLVLGNDGGFGEVCELAFLTFQRLPPEQRALFMDPERIEKEDRGPKEKKARAFERQQLVLLREVGKELRDAANANFREEAMQEYKRVLANVKEANARDARCLTLETSLKESEAKLCEVTQKLEQVSQAYSRAQAEVNSLHAHYQAEMNAIVQRERTRLAQDLQQHLDRQENAHQQTLQNMKHAFNAERAKTQQQHVDPSHRRPAVPAPEPRFGMRGLHNSGSYVQHTPSTAGGAGAGPSTSGGAGGAPSPSSSQHGSFARYIPGGTFTSGQHGGSASGQHGGSASGQHGGSASAPSLPRRGSHGGEPGAKVRTPPPVYPGYNPQGKNKPEPKTQGTRRFHGGARIVLHNLQRRGELNGKLGVIHAIDSSNSGRWFIALDDQPDKQLSVREDNMQITPASWN